ncbi:MAG TPA: hypothetical protein VGB30_02600 [bacterium]
MVEEQDSDSSQPPSRYIHLFNIYVRNFGGATYCVALKARRRPDLRGGDSLLGRSG